MREARRIEQSHNPNYLKSKSSKKEQINIDNTNVDDIPIQELTLDVPIKITCKNPLASQLSWLCLMSFHLFLATKRSDKYFEEQNKRSSKKKPIKKTKKNKKLKLKEVSSESEEGMLYENRNRNTGIFNCLSLLINFNICLQNRKLFMW